MTNGEILNKAYDFLKMEDIKIPMHEGSMDDISQEASSQVENSDLDSMSTQGQRAIYEREARITIDYDMLDEDDKELVHTDEVKKRLEQLNKGVVDMHATLQRINAPNMKAMEK